MTSQPANETRGTEVLSRLLRAQSLAVVGASGKAGSFGHALLRQLIERGFRGEICPVNPGWTEIDGLHCYPSLAELPGEVDCALLAVADERLEAALAGVAEARIPAAVIFGGLPRPDDPDSLTERLRRIAREAGIGLLGGNCMGFYNAVDRLFVSGYPVAAAPECGGVAVISHSGSSFSAFANSGRGLRYSYLISPGQELTHTAADYIEFLLDQPETRVIGLFLETVRDPAGFVAALERAAERAIPIVVLKVGRSERGRAMALAHSGALAGSDDAFAAVCARWNVIHVDSLDEMADTLELLSSARTPANGGLALAGDSGGERALIVDRAAALHVPWADLNASTLDKIRAVLDAGLEAANPLDLWGSGRDWQHIYESCLTTMAEDPATGIAVLAVDLVRGSRLVPDYVDIVVRVHEATGQPVAVMGNLASAIDPAAATRLREHDVPVLMGTETGLLAIRHALTWRPAAPRLPQSTDDRDLAQRCAPSLASRPEPLSELEAKQLLAAWDIPVIAERLVNDEEEAVEAAQALGWPVVIKTATPGVLHKTDAGGVIFDVGDEAAVRASYRDLRRRLGRAVLIQRQITAAERVELFLGLTLDPQFGPLVSFGLGGIWVEALADVVTALPPIDAVTAQRLLLELRGSAVLRGMRGRNPVDIEAAAAAIAAFSRMAVALGPYLAEVDVNPLIATADGVVAVDALVVPRAAIEAT